MVVENMARTLGQQFIIENVVGAGGTTGSLRAMRARPDGYTILMGHIGTHAFSVSLYPRASGSDGSARRGSSTWSGSSRLTPRVLRWNSATATPAATTPISAPGTFALILAVPKVTISTPAPSASV